MTQPDNAALPGPLAPGDPRHDLGLGRLVCIRASRAAYWIIAVVLTLVSLGTGLGAVARALAPRPNYVASAVGMAFFIGLSAIVYLCVRQGRTTVRFYELGVAKYIGRKPRTVIAWVEASELTYKVIKQSFEGIPVGTSVSIQIKTDDKRKVSFSGNHKTKVKSKKLFGPKEVVRIDELDFIRDLVSESVADRLGDKLLARETIPWGGVGYISDQGFTPRRGKYKGELVPFQEIDRESANEGVFSLYRAGDDRPFVSVQMAAPNFWPGVALLHRMIGVSAPEGSEKLGVEEGARAN